MKHKETKPRILFVGTLPPPVHGSAVVSQQIMNSKLINDMFDCDWVNLGTSRGMDEIGKRNFSKMWRFFSSLSKEFWLLSIRHYDLCYLAITCHGNGFLKDSPFMLLARLFCKKRVIHQHNKGMAKDVDKWPYRWLLPLCYRNAKVILLSWHLYPDIEKVVKRENVLICPNGIKINTNYYENQKKTNRIPKLLFLSNLIESKGVMVLLDALKILADKGYSFKCDFVGGETKEIDAKRFAEEVVKRQLNRFVVYQGRKYGEDKEEAFEQSDIFVFPTYYANETFGLVNLEAMAHKLPIVSTNEGGIPDVVKDGENGFLAEKRDIDSLAHNLMTLIMNKNMRQQFGKRSKEILYDNYSLNTFRDRYIQTIKEL